MTQQELTRLYVIHGMAGYYHDSPATKAYSCKMWQRCDCKKALALQQAEQFLAYEQRKLDGTI